jgi:PAS domain S-box-containing protein
MIYGFVAVSIRREQAARQQFQRIFDNAPMGIALLDLEGHPLVANPQLTRFLGITEKDLRDTSFTEFTHPDDATRDWAQYQQLIRGEIDHYSMEKRYVRPGGQVVWGSLGGNRDPRRARAPHTSDRDGRGHRRTQAQPGATPRRERGRRKRSQRLRRHRREWALRLRQPRVSRNVGLRLTRRGRRHVARRSLRRPRYAAPHHLDAGRTGGGLLRVRGPAQGWLDFHRLHGCPQDHRWRGQHALPRQLYRYHRTPPPGARAQGARRAAASVAEDGRDRPSSQVASPTTSTISYR